MATSTWLGAGGTAGDWGVAANWDGGVPIATDDVVIALPSTQAITASLDQSGVAIAKLDIQKGFAQTIGVEGTTSAMPTYLQVDPDSFFFETSGGISFIDIGAAAIDVVVRSTGSQAQGKFGLNLKGSAISDLSVSAGSVQLAGFGGETSTVTNVRVLGGKVRIGPGVTLTTATVKSGELIVECAATTLECFGGTLRTEGSGAVTTVNVRNGGTATLNSSGTITTLDVRAGGTATFITSGIPRTITNLNMNPSAKVSYNPDVLTVTNKLNTAPDEPIALLVERA